MVDDAPRRSLLQIDVASGPQTTLTLAGEVDPGTAPELQDRLAQLAGDAAISSVVIDLGQITFLDSSGVRAVIAGSEALRSGGAELILRGANPNVRRVLEVTGLTQLLTVE
ncbi:MAG TPA: STAS domain-containing protein [Acidimicrobiales bacterium]|nr:STAS domain-containing protein [Acidimicrobiales bacterium]